ncbi:MAG TPA: VOC family protein [Candidatus Dormibacteraeota bacterium]|nr:VOC family protein [Candidatus Dormibacteraeota bacterium]
MPTTNPDVIPMLAYEDGPRAMDWLARFFGFRERMRMKTRDGRLSHGEMETGGGVIMLATPTPDYESPKHHRDGCEQARKWSSVPYIIDGVLVSVDDVSAHYAHARDGGATILSALEGGDNGKRYRAEDLEGHRWMFIERQ